MTEIQYLFGLRKFSSKSGCQFSSPEEVRAAAELAQLGGGAKSRDRHVARGKMLPRDRWQTCWITDLHFLRLGPRPRMAFTMGRPRCGDDCGHRYSFGCDLHDPVQ